METNESREWEMTHNSPCNGGERMSKDTRSDKSVESVDCIRLIVTM